MKYLTRDGSAETLYGLNGELFRGITHQIDVDGQGATDFSNFEAVSWGSGATAGTGQMLAVDDVNNASTMWIQLLTGVVPTDGMEITGGTSGATCDVNGSVTSRTLSTPFIGASTGSALIGAYGIGLETSDLTNADSVIDLGANTITPPNNVTYTVNGLVSGEDRVLVAPWDGATTDAEGNPAIEQDQLSLSTALTGAAETSIVVSAIPSDTPASGTIRVMTNSGLAQMCTYTSWTGSTFTINSADFSGDNADASNDVWLSYIDKLAASSSESFSVVYAADRDLVIIVRDGAGTPIKQFISSGSIGSGGGSISVIRTSDA